MIVTTGTVQDLRASAKNMVDGAIAVTTGRLHLDRPADTLERIINNDSTALEYFRHELAHQIAVLLIQMDPSVGSVYKEHELPEAEELGTPMLNLGDPLFLVVYSRRETAALRSLASALDQSLVDVLSEFSGSIAPGLLHIDIIDEVRARRANARAGGFRPPPTKLVERSSKESGIFNETQAL
jgi:hypothetical protein